MVSIRKLGNYQKYKASFNSWSVWIYKLKWERICTGVSEVASGCIYPKYENLIECQERQHIDVIPGTGDFNFAEKSKYLEIESAWFPMVAKGTNSGHL